MPETAHPDEPRLPQEICDLIIDYNHSDRATLKTLALVSRAWLASARYHIFYSIHIVTDLELLGSGVAPLNFKDARSISLLGMGPPSSFPVRHLIVGKSNILGALHEPSSIESIFAIMAHFPRVHSLSLKHIYIEDDVTNTVTKLKTSFTTFPSRLHMLELSRFFRVRAIRPISDIIRMFTSISYLKLDHLYRNAESFEHEPWHDYPTPPSHKIPVDRLDFELSRVQDVPVFMEDLYSAVDVANVGCLGLTYLTEVVPPEFIKLVETSSGRLTSLIVKTHGRGRQPRDDRLPGPSSLNLSSCESLVSLKVIFLLTSPQDTFDVFDMFSTLPRSCALTNVILRFKVYFSIEAYLERSIQNPVWQHIGTALRSLSHLETVQIVIYTKYHPSSGISSRIQEWLTGTLALPRRCRLGFVWEISSSAIQRSMG